MPMYENFDCFFYLETKTHKKICICSIETILRDGHYLFGRLKFLETRRMYPLSPSSHLTSLFFVSKGQRKKRAMLAIKWERVICVIWGWGPLRAGLGTLFGTWGWGVCTRCGIVRKFSAELIKTIWKFCASLRLPEQTIIFSNFPTNCVRNVLPDSFF